MEPKLKPKSVLLIEDDPTWRKVLKKYLNQSGVATIDQQEEGEAAWASLSTHKKPRYDLIFLDWNVPKLNGLSLLNRIRKNEVYAETPVIIISGFLHDEDLRLFEEFPFTEGLTKPVSLAQLTRAVDLVMDEAAWFKKEREAIVQIFQKIEGGGSQSLFQLRQLVSNAPKPNAVVIAAAKLLIFSERYTAAEELLSYFLDDSPDSLTGLNQLAKVYLHTRRYSEARELLEHAQKLSPKNLERLCILGDAKLHSLQIDEAQRSFERALAIDKQSLPAKIGHDFAGIVSTKIAHLSDDSIPRAYSSLLNSKGIIAARGGQFDTAIEQYRNAMVYTIDPLTKGRVAYNVGLAYVRWSKPEDALAWLQRSLTYSKGEFKKAGAKLSELNTFLSNPANRALSEDANILVSPRSAATTPSFERMKTIDEKKGDEASSLDQEIEEFERIEIPESFALDRVLNAPKKKAG